MPIGTCCHRPRQLPSQVIDVAGWEGDEDHPVFPVGSKPKELLICPSEVSEPFLIPGHRYLFKRALTWQSYQTWSEVIAYELARGIGLPLPACFIAINTARQEIGVLCEFFYGYPGDPAPPRLVHASDLLQRAAPEFDLKGGRPHSVRFNALLCRAAAIEDPLGWWATTLTFDALIGNTDRHPQNWGFMVNRQPGQPPRFSMAPIFDNGTSLGYEVQEVKLAERTAPQALSNYINRGRHHACWEGGASNGDHHFELCRRLLEFSPETGVACQNVIRLSDREIGSVMTWATEFDIHLRFSELRAAFVTALVKSRRNALGQIFGG